MKTRSFCSRTRAALLAILAVTSANAQKDAPDPEGKKLVRGLCGGCHPLALATSRRATRDEWERTIQVMMRKGLDAPEDDLMKALDYLAKNYGEEKEDGAQAAAKLNVNTAPAETIAGVLKIPVSAATSIIEYREAHGKFKVWQDLGKAPGVDMKKVEAKKDRLVY